MAKIYGKGGTRLRHIPHVFEAVGLSYIVRLSRDRGALCYLSGSGADEPRFPYRWICAVFFLGGGLVLWRSSLKNFLVDSRYFFLSLDSGSPQFLPHPTARRFWATTALLVRSGAHSHLLVDSSLRIFRWYFHGMSSSCPHSEITYTKRNMLLEPMGLKQDTLFWILALCKNIFGYHPMLGLLARLFINSFVMPSLFLLHGNAASYYFLHFSELKEVKNREYKAPLHDAFEGWGYPFEKRKKTGFAAKANLVSDDSSLLWRYNNHPQVPCGPYAAATGNTISLCIPRSDGLHCEVKCSDDRPPRSNTLRCGHRGVWVGNIECHSADLTDASFVPTLWPKDGPQPPIVMERSWKILTVSWRERENMWGVGFFNPDIWAYIMSLSL